MKNFLKNTKAFVSVHAGSFFIAGFVIGAGLVYYLIMKGMLPVIGGGAS